MGMTLIIFVEITSAAVHFLWASDTRIDFENPVRIKGPDWMDAVLRPLDFAEWHRTDV